MCIVKILAAAMVMAWACGLASAAQPSSSRPTGGAPPFRRTASKPDGFTVEINAFLSQIAAAYQSADSYRDVGRVTLVQQAGRVKTTTEMPMELTFQRPNLLRLDAGRYVVACDGKTLSTTMEALRQFTVTTAPARLERQHLAGGPAGGGTDGGHPDMLDFLIRPEAGESLLAQVARIGWMPDQRVGGVTCRVLTYQTIQGAKVMMCIETQRMVLRRVEAEAAADDPGGPTRLTYELEKVQLNPKLNVTAFAFAPPAGFRQVRQFAVGPDPFDPPVNPTARNESEPGGAHLIGKPAPGFNGRDLAGAPVASTEFEGKVVLLFFWSLAGGEHCLRAIPMVQEMGERFRDRPEVVVLGVCPDAGETTVVKQLLARKQATFRTLLDTEMKTQTAFGLEGVPTFVIIGRDGKVAWAELGAPPKLKGDLTREIEKLLPPAAPK